MPGRPCRSDCCVRHSSQIYDEARCQLCQLQGKTSWTQRKCLDLSLHFARLSAETAIINGTSQVLTESGHIGLQRDNQVARRVDINKSIILICTL